MSAGATSPTRVACRFHGKEGQIVLDQIRTVDRVRLVKKLGQLGRKTTVRVLEILNEISIKAMPEMILETNLFFLSAGVCAPASYSHGKTT